MINLNSEKRSQRCANAFFVLVLWSLAFIDQIAFASSVDDAMFAEINFYAQSQPDLVDGFIESNRELISDTVINCFDYLAGNPGPAAGLPNCAGDKVCEDMMMTYSTAARELAATLRGESKWLNTASGTAALLSRNQMIMAMGTERFEESISMTRQMIHNKGMPKACY